MCFKQPMGWTTPSSWWVGHFFLSCHHFEELPELQMILVEPNIVAVARRGRWKLFRTYLSRVFQVYGWHFLPISILMFGFAIYHFCRPVRALIVLIRSPTPKPSLPLADTIVLFPIKSNYCCYIYIYKSSVFFDELPLSVFPNQIQKLVLQCYIYFHIM